MTVLYVFFGEMVAAKISRGRHDLTLTYEEGYLASPRSVPLSYSLPLTTAPQENKKVYRFLANLIPENEIYLNNLKALHRLKNTRDPLEILGVLGAEAPGVFQYSLAPTPPCQVGSMERISDTEIERILVSLQAQRPSRGDRHSLAGYQPKTSFRKGGDGLWYLANGRAASTHIFKPPPVDEPELDVIEHVMAMAARGLGITTARTDVLTFGSQRCFVSERYDRHTEGDRVRRLHQEDFAQALGRSREQKYQKNGGPTLVDLLKLCELVSPGDTDMLVKLVAFNVRGGNTDAHAKNYSFLITHEGHRLAPAYDLLSLTPFGNKYTNELAMTIGSATTAHAVTDRHWTWVANKAKLDPKRVLDSVHFVYDNFDSALTTARNESHIDDPSLDLIASGQNPENKSTAAQPGQGSDVWVPAHLRKGKPVSGYWRSRRKS